MRFDLRFLAYALLAQEPYPRHLFGDVVASSGGGDHGAVPASLSYDQVESVDELGDVGQGSELVPALSDPSINLSAPRGESGDARVTASSPALAGHASVASSTASEASAWTLTMTKSSKVLIGVLMVVGLVGFVLYTTSVRPHIQNDSSEVAWSSLYSNDISAVTQAVSVAQPDFDSSPLPWHAITVDCSNINAALLSLRVPQYPQKTQDELLVSGVEQVSSGVRACLETVVPNFDATEESAMAKDFASGNRELTTFLNQIPLRSFAT